LLPYRLQQRRVHTRYLGRHRQPFPQQKQLLRPQHGLGQPGSGAALLQPVA